METHFRAADFDTIDADWTELAHTAAARGRQARAGRLTDTHGQR
ncbi:hypothetical protein ACH47Z_42400 [Streptomyces sp. NPDC020192]